MLTLDPTDTNFHRLLKRQIRKSLPPELAENPALQDFLTSVNQAYIEYQDDIARVEHILEQSSGELFKANKELTRIAEEKTQEAAITSKRLEEVVGSISEVLVQLDREGHIRYLNNAWEVVTGYTVEESLNKKWVDFPLPDESLSKIQSIFESELQNIDETIRILTADHTEKWLGVSLSHHISPDNQLVGYIGTLVDITSRKEQEAEINRLVEWLNESGEAVQVSDENGMILFVNYEAARRLGKTREEIIGSNVSEIEKIFEEAGEWETYLQNLRNTSKMILSGVHTRKDGSTFPVETSVKYYENNNQGYVLSFIRDITERVEADKKLKAYTRDLERINAELDQFAYVVSHDLKAPLRAINNLSEWIEEDLEDMLEGDTKDQFRLLRGRVHRMEGLINGILSYSRAGRIKTNKEKFLVKPLVDDLCETLAPRRFIRFDVEGDEALEIFSEKIALQQILQNLISNGIKYNDKENIAISIGWTETLDMIEFYVKDNGPGISPEFHERIFVIFQTLQSRDEVESTGVGLAIVKKIVQEKGGTIRIQSEMGNYTTFYFTWPKNESKETESQQ